MFYDELNDESFLISFQKLLPSVGEYEYNWRTSEN